MVIRGCSLFTLTCFGMGHDLNSLKSFRELPELIYCVNLECCKGLRR